MLNNLFPQKKAEWGLLIGSTLLTLLLVEVVLRQFYPQINEHDDMFQVEEPLGWRFIPNKIGSIVYAGEVHHHIRINELGFRDATFQSSYKRKIVVSGDSFVSNISVPQQAVFTEVIESRLDSTLLINCGVNGYGQVQSYLLLQELIPKLQPDLIIHQIYLRNDFKDNMLAEWLAPRPIVNLENDSLSFLFPSKESRQVGTKTTTNSFFNQSHLYTLVKRSFSNIWHQYIQTRKHPERFPPEITFCNPSLTETFKKQLRVLQKLIIAIDNLGSINNTEVLFVLAPSIAQIEDNFWELLVSEYADQQPLQRNFINQQLMEFATQNKLSMIDLYPALRREVAKKEPLYFPKEQHWTEKGNLIVANTIQDYLLANYSIK